MDERVWGLVNNYLDMFETPGALAAARAAELWDALVALVGLSEAQRWVADAHRSRSMARWLLTFIREDR